jgi:hypothetical protein
MNDCIIDYTIRIGEPISKEMEEALKQLMPHIRAESKHIEIKLSSTPKGRNELYEKYKIEKFFADWQKVIDSEVNDS